MKINNAVIGVGSNINPEENILRAEQEVALLGSSLRKSGFVYTKPLGYENQNDFLNGVFHIETGYDLKEINEKLKKIENKLGRVRTANKFGPRTIDLDTVIFNNQVKDKDVFERDFIKSPVKELLPELSVILDCYNYKNHFSLVDAIIGKIISILPVIPVSVYGCGQWFGDEEPADGKIKIFVIIKNNQKKYEEYINQQLRLSGLHEIGSYPVRVRLFRQGEQEVAAQGRSVITNSPSNKLLYGKPLSVSDTLFQS